MAEFVHQFASLDTFVLDNLGLDVDPEHYSKHFSLAWIPGVLRGLSAPIRKLVLEISAREISQLDAVPWSMIDEVVADPLNAQFGALDRVEILLDHRWSSEGGSFLKGGETLHEVFRPRLPQIGGMGLLRCSFVGFLR